MDASPRASYGSPPGVLRPLIFFMPSGDSGPRDLLLRATPTLFVLVWSTGWIAAGYAAPYADPLTFLVIRHALAAAGLGAIAFAFAVPWPRGRAAILHAMAAGALLNGFYLAGVWWAVRHGVPAGLSGVIAALQPIFTAALAPLLIGEKVGARRWAGVAIGFGGLTVAFAPRLAALDSAALGATLWPIAVNVLAMVSVTLGTFYQKRFAAAGDLRAVTALQFIGAFLVTLPLAILFEPMHIVWNRTIILTMLWSVLALSIGGISAFVYLIRRGAVAKAAALIYLVPPVTAAMAWIAFGETLSLLQIAGLCATVAGVWLAAGEAKAKV